MLQIYIYGPIESGFLELLPATELDIESLSDIFDEDLTLGEYSLPMDVPWTEHNRRLLGNAERFKNFNYTDISYKSVVYDDFYPELTAAQFSIIGKNGNFSGTKGTFQSVITGTKGLFGSQIKNKKLTDLSLGGKISWEDLDSRHFAESLMKGGYPAYNYITFVPVAIESFFDTSRPDYDDEFLAKDTVNTVMVTGAGPDAWMFGRPTEEDPSIAAVEGNEEYADYRTVPFIKTKWLLRKVFEEQGYIVSGEFFDSADFDDLVTFNNYAIENYSPDHIDYNRYIFPTNHVPDILLIDYLKGLFSFFNMYPIFSGSNMVQLKFRKNLKTEKKIFSLNGIAAELFTSDKQTVNNGDGYTLAYQWGNDNYQGDWVKDLKDKNLVATVSRWDDLANVNPGRQLTTDDIVFVTAENIYYEVADATTSPVKWDAYAEALDDYVSGAGDRSVDITISTLCTYIELDPDSQLYVRKDYVGARMTGSYINNKGILVKSDFGNKIFFAARRNNSSNVLVPFSWNHNRDSNNVLINSFSLAWSGDTGIAKIFHDDWQQIKQNQETVKTSLDIDRRVMAGIQNNNFLEIKNCFYLLNLVEKTIPMKETMDIQLIVI